MNRGALETDLRQPKSSLIKKIGCNARNGDI